MKRAFAKRKAIQSAKKDSGLTTWLDFPEFDTVTLNGPDLRKIEDKTGNGNDFEQTTPGDQPLYDISAQNGLNAIELDGSEFLNGTTNYDNTDSATYFIVYQSSVPVFGTLYQDVGAGTNRLTFDILGFAFQLFFIGIDSDNEEIRAFTPNVTPAFSLVVATRKPGEIFLDNNDTTDTTIDTYAPSTLEGGFVPTLGASRVPIFPGRWFTGHIGEFKHYNRELTMAEIITKKTSLITKWAL